MAILSQQLINKKFLKSYDIRKALEKRENIVKAGLGGTIGPISERLKEFYP